MIKIDFTKNHTIYGTYSDALHLQDDHTFTDQEIESMKQERFDNWVSHIINASNNPLEVIAPLDESAPS